MLPHKASSFVHPSLTEFSVHDHLPARLPLAERWPILALGLSAIFTIAYIVHVPSPPGYSEDQKHPTAQLACNALLPLAVCAPIWFWLTVNLSGETTQWAARGNTIFVVMCWLSQMCSSIRWTFSPTRPSYHPLTRPPFFDFIRQTRMFKALNLPLMEYRLHGLTQYSSPYTGNAPRYFPSVLNHVGHLLLRLFLFDALTLGIHLLDPTNLGAICAAVSPKDWDAGIATMSQKTGLPREVMPVLMTAVSTMITYAGVGVGWDQHALMAVGSGLWALEEWPPVMRAPWKSQSLNELWGRRYHTYLRNVFHIWTLPFAWLPHALHIPRIFLGSAIHHSLLLYPFAGAFSFRANLLQYMIPALGCSLERLYWKRTGRKVRGRWGAVWTWTIFLWSCYYGTKEWYSVGWAERYRCDLEEVSPVVAVMRALGWDVMRKAKAE